MRPGENPSAPIPVLISVTSSGDARERNSWRQLATTVPVHSERSRYNATTITPLPPASRSPFRTGTLQFLENGILFDGHEVAPNARVERATKIISGCLLVLAAILAISSYLPALHTLRPLGNRMMWIWMGFGPIVAIIMDRQRKRVASLIPWDNVFGAQVDTNSRWITLIYNHLTSTTVTESGSSITEVKVFESRFLSLNKLDGATIEGIAETLRRYAPDCYIGRMKAYEWTTGRKIAFGILGVPVVSGLILLCVLAWKTIFP